MSSRQAAIEAVRAGLMRWPVSFRRAIALEALARAECAASDDEALPLIQEAHAMLKQWRIDHIYRIRHGGG